MFIFKKRLGFYNPSLDILTYTLDVIVSVQTAI